MLMLGDEWVYYVAKPRGKSSEMAEVFMLVDYYRMGPEYSMPLQVKVAIFSLV